MCRERIVRPDPQGINQLRGWVSSDHNGDRQRAIAQLTQAVAENPDLTMAHILLGEMYRSNDDYRKAVPQYEAAVRLDPYELKNHYYLGISYQFLDRLQGGQTLFGRPEGICATAIRT